MQPEQTIPKHPSTAPEESTRNKLDWKRYDFLAPFVGAAFLALPTLIVLTLTRQTVGFMVLAELGMFQVIQVVLWVLVLVASVSGSFYIVRSRSWVSKLAALGLLLATVICFVYIQLP